MSQSDQKSLPYPVMLVIGLVAAVGGTYLSVNHMIPGTDKLASMGLVLDLGMTIATIGVFLILFPLLKSFFLVPLQTAIQERNTNLEKTFAEADELRSEMQKMRTDYERRMVETEAQAREHIQTQIREAQQLRTTLMEEATRKTDALVLQAQQEIPKAFQ